MFFVVCCRGALVNAHWFRFALLCRLCDNVTLLSCYLLNATRLLPSFLLCEQQKKTVIFSRSPMRNSNNDKEPTEQYLILQAKSESNRTKCDDDTHNQIHRAPFVSLNDLISSCRVVQNDADTETNTKTTFFFSLHLNFFRLTAQNVTKAIDENWRKNYIERRCRRERKSRKTKQTIVCIVWF